jgi:fermentation-respiration switch protein FrsA (DUF1100 family)
VIRILILLACVYVGLGFVLFFARNRIIFPARGGEAGEPARFGIKDGQAVTIETGDGNHLAGWFLPAVPPAVFRAPVLVWFHGNGETVAGLASVLSAFRPAGVALLAVDYRGYGASSGHATVGDVERDALLLWDYLARRGDVDTARVVVYGRSIGTGPAVMLAASRPARGLVLESAFTSLGAMVREGFPVFPAFLAGRGFDNLGRIDAVRCPILLIHGGHDTTIPTAMGRALAARAGARGELFIIPSADHNETYDLGGAEYVRRVKAFVARVVAAP